MQTLKYYTLSQFVLLAIIIMASLSFTNQSASEALLPDLQITVPDSLFGSFCTNKHNKVYVKIANIGQYKAQGEVLVKLRIDPVRINRSVKIKVDLAPGQVRQVVFEKIKFRSGDNRITGIANQEKVLAETNYYNNGQTKSVHVANCP
ncbi:MAG: hypothetical protein HKN76_20460 [Saprospiraceae bacterium]|nr:hypothetical protein [Saprospiraceae bacterium]